MEPLARRKISRSALQNHCKKLELKITGLVDKPNLGAEEIKQLKSLRLSYDNQIKKIATADSEVINLLTTENEVQDDMEASLVLEDIFCDFLSKIDEKLSEASSK